MKTLIAAIHGIMTSQTDPSWPDKFDAWLQSQQRALAGPPGQAGKTVFANNGCGACHTYAPAGSKGKVGPDLDKLPAYAKQAGKPLQDFVRESIVNPNAYIQPGYPKNVMPGNFGQLPKGQLDALVSFLMQKGSK